MDIWLIFRTGAPLLGGAIVLDLNAGLRTKRKISSETYLVFIALQCVAAPVALLVSPPEKVQRADGSKVVMEARTSFKDELTAIWATSMRRDVLLLLPVF